MDGTLGSQTAWMLDGSGVRITSGEELAEIIRRGARAGWPVAVHAIGDRANREALDAFEATRDEWAPRGLRQRIEHAQCLAPEDVARFAEIGVACSVQFSHAPSDRDLADRFWADRATARTRSARSGTPGALVANGSDAPVEELDPLAGIRAGRAAHDRRASCLASRAGADASSRRCGDDRQPRPGSRATSGVRGKLLPGYLADLVVLYRDPLECPPTSSSRSKSWRRWSAAAGCTTRRRGTDRGTSRSRCGRRSTAPAHPAEHRVVQSGRGFAHDAPHPCGADLLRRRRSRDRRLEVDGAHRPRSLGGAASLHRARALVRGDQPADARGALALARDRGDRRAPELPGIAAARRVRADGEGQGAPPDRARDAPLRPRLARLRRPRAPRRLEQLAGASRSAPSRAPVAKSRRQALDRTRVFAHRARRRSAPWDARR